MTDTTTDTLIGSLEAAALAFHVENPHVLSEITTVCLQMRQVGQTRWSINAAFEVVRYQAALTTTGRTYKLNNNHRAFYARWIQAATPELAGFFATRDHGRVPQDLTD